MGIVHIEIFWNNNLLQVPTTSVNYDGKEQNFSKWPNFKRNRTSTINIGRAKTSWGTDEHCFASPILIVQVPFWISLKSLSWITCSPEIWATVQNSLGWKFQDHHSKFPCVSSGSSTIPVLKYTPLRAFKRLKDFNLCICFSTSVKLKWNLKSNWYTCKL